MGKKFDVNAAAASVDLTKRKSAHLKDMLDTSTRTVKMIPLSQIDDFPEHPFYVKDDEDMAALVGSIKLNGVLTPITLVEKADGRYGCISGHRRRRACQIAELTEIPAIIENMTEDEATIAMVDANLQREKILPSEKARAYRMKMDAMKRQGKRTDLTSGQLVQKLVIEELRNVAMEAIERCSRKRVRDWTAIKTAIKNDLSGYLYKTTKRNPMILPVIMEI